MIVALNRVMACLIPKHGYKDHYILGTLCDDWNNLL